MCVVASLKVRPRVSSYRGTQKILRRSDPPRCSKSPGKGFGKETAPQSSYFSQSRTAKVAGLVDLSSQILYPSHHPPLLGQRGQGNLLLQELALLQANPVCGAFACPATLIHKTRSLTRPADVGRQQPLLLLTEKRGKSLVTIAPSSAAGTMPNAPFRASIRERMNWPCLATNRRCAATSVPSQLSALDNVLAP